jgi:hypothetical protein
MRWMIIFLLPLCLLGHAAQQTAKFAENQCRSVRVSRGDLGEGQLNYCDNETDRESYLSAEFDMRPSDRDKKSAADFLTGSTNLETKPSGSRSKGNQTRPCITNRSAPPIGPYHWPADTEVKVFFVRDMFPPEQRSALLEAMASWTIAGQENGSGVRFTDAGTTDSRMNCRGCLTVGRNDVYRRDKRYYAFFYPISEGEGQLVSAWIELDFGITKSKALKGFMVHELGHGLGLWDCRTCKKKQTVMNRFPNMNNDNGLGMPSTCDLATVRDVYRSDRLMAKSKRRYRKFGRKPIRRQFIE